MLTPELYLELCPSECETQKFLPTINNRLIKYDSEYQEIENTGYSRINVYQGSYEKTVVTEVPKITEEGLFSSLGGILGLMLGSSILSVVEILELILNLTVTLISDKIICQKKANKKIKPSSTQESVK